jgi:16S rRNA (cytosine967-C5)-methyltransferase
MNPNIAANQQRLFLEFLAELRPYLHRDSALPRRIKEILARHRAIGSRDRKLYRELIYTWLRFLPWVDTWLDKEPATAAKIVAWLAPDLKPTAHYRAALCGDWPAAPDTLAEKATVLTQLFQSDQHTPAQSATPLDRGDSDRKSPLERGAQRAGCVGSSAPRSPLLAPRFFPTDLLPAWFREHCPAAFTPPHLDALNSRASIWVRVQCNDRNLVLDEFRAQGWSFTIAGEFPDAICLPPNADVAGTDAYRRGFIEIQDLGSQMVLACAGIAPGGSWLDACAGAGGKTLQLARLVGPGGHVDATDLRPEILEELRDRTKRARLGNIAIIQKPAADYDGVLVDAPCSGSGTWRRQPHLKWYGQPETIASFAKTQLEILTASAPLVRPGGRLIYATCSLSHCENHDVVAAFLKARPQFTVQAPAKNFGEFDGLGTALLPGTRNTDGFYVATLQNG